MHRLFALHVLSLECGMNVVKCERCVQGSVRSLRPKKLRTACHIWPTFDNLLQLRIVSVNSSFDTSEFTDIGMWRLIFVRTRVAQDEQNNEPSDAFAVVWNGKLRTEDLN